MKIKKLLIILTLITSFIMADSNDTIRANNKSYVNNTYKNKIITCKGNPDILILPGLEANRKTKQLNIIGEATGLKEGETAEYFLIGENSGHDYESLAISFALPSDIRKALIFLGMKPGRAVNYKEMQFWPKGERVIMNFRKAFYSSLRDNHGTRAEKLIKNSKNNITIPELGFVFTGSIEVTSTTNKNLKALAADVFDPMSIAANYNEADSILDLPRLAKQNDVYETQVVSSEYKFKPGELLNISIEQEYKNGKKRILDLNLKINCTTATTNTKSQLLFTLINNGVNILSNAPLPKLLKEIKTIINEGQDPFVTIDFADNLPLKNANKICSILEVLDSEKGIRIEPPVKNQLYYKSFTPEEYLRERKNRLPIKWEIHIKLINNKVKYSLTNIDPHWKDNESAPTIRVTEHEIINSDELIKLLKTKEVGIPAILVFAEPDITYKQLMKIIEPVRSIYEIVHIFIL